MERDRDGELSSELALWIERRAAELDQSPTTVLERAVAAHRLVVGVDADSDADGLDVDDLPDPERVDELADGLDAIDARLDEAITDLRERIVEVLKTAEAKAPQDHDHPDLTGATAELEDDVADLAADLQALDDRVDGGFENYEAVLEALGDRTESLGDRTDSLAEAVADLRSRLHDVEAATTRRAAVGELRRTANRQGVREAGCESCGAVLDVALLTEPQCPHCGEAFDDVEPGQGLLGSATLTAGDRPALTDANPPENRSETTEAPDSGDPMPPSGGSR